ncbi:hypothetical protein A2Z22_03615 [Candidatus Woesebacteria bacterium RBG_16_34_12]|uniref:Uncharacterized protein n=1 Tax=Candidatus Woesebacteria bacterium RBG_16_34_12 TaxID=1802480 RepID=A0A1F7X7J8_9BACT|nr:MAG: hypothetical protein A2Z22_03615 [Candidatus Woesebacteria bacterium RBG_16_34_12]
MMFGCDKKNLNSECEMKDRILGYDVARFFAILTVFFAHILLYQTNNKIIFVSLASLSPGITMSLLGFISAALLSKTTDFMANFPSFNNVLYTSASEYFVQAQK